MKNKIFLLFLLMVSSFNFLGQTKINEKEFESFKLLPQESIFIHFNTNFLLTGEKLFYKVNSVNLNTKLNSDLSKIAYVEIINNNKVSVLKHKIRLEKGVGQGDFFITNKIETGSYKLIGYTEWMKNKNLFFQENITIINPFSSKIKTVSSKSEVKEYKNLKENEIIVGNISLNLNKDTFQKREKVTVSISSKDSKKIAGNFSISVRQVNPFLEQDKMSSVNFVENLSSINLTKSTLNNNSIFLPEFRGELISGKISAKSENFPLENLRVGLSIIEEDGVFKVSNTDKNGFFHFNILEKYSSEKAYFQVLEKDNENYSIQILENKGLDFSKLNFNALEIDSLTRNLIINRSAQVQIENAYSNLKQDSVIEKISPNNLFNNKFKVYDLDDFTRFKTIRETMVEIIEDSWVNKSGDNYSFHVRDYNRAINYNSNPLLLIDNYIITNANEIINFSSKKIKTIAISQEIFKFNSKIYEGVIIFKTINGDYSPKVTPEVLPTQIVKPLAIKKYFSQIYIENSKELERIPDYRTQLLWEPNLDLSKKQISFFTSDIPGYFEISIEGFTIDGNPLSVKKMILVK